ncbi:MULTISPECIES: metalloregulator ArsR/SmtB family transcription factor [unclassified Nocardia]|uniref:ArsR/SmtB family transcription factor n=1 Tax=unclassified Nocardia TaxID=2637762 RepID=UPI0024A92298|nr:MULTISPECIES: metalloregulator ArsR/SmtB family transcription factor [unclassified Nocardia]
MASSPTSTAPPAVLATDDHDAVAKLFKALGDPIRVKLLTLVHHAPQGESCFCDLAEEFDMPQSSLSHHLKILVAAGILTRERRGTWSWYRVDHDALDTMEAILRTGGPLRSHRCDNRAC